MYKIPLKELKSYRESHPELYTKTELKKIKLRGTEPVAEYHNMNSHKTVLFIMLCNLRNGRNSANGKGD